MNGINFQHSDFEVFEKIAAPWNVEERLRKEVPPPGLATLSGDNAFSLKSMFGLSSTQDYERNLSHALGVIWKEIEENAFSKLLVGELHYRNASSSFERKLRKIAGENTKTKKRIHFRYLTGYLIYVVLRVPRPVRLIPDKDTADRISKRIDALLHDMENPDEYSHWADYRLKAALREFRNKMEASKSMQRVPNSLSPANYFVFQLAQLFVEYFDEPMPAVLSDLCGVVGANPDESTINRWVAQALQYRSSKPAQGETPAT